MVRFSIRLAGACASRKPAPPMNLVRRLALAKARALGELQIRSYIKREQPLDCAGSFKCKGLGIAWSEALTWDDPRALLGLPLIALASRLSRAGFDILVDSP